MLLPENKQHVPLCQMASLETYDLDSYLVWLVMGIWAGKRSSLTSARDVPTVQQNNNSVRAEYGHFHFVLSLGSPPPLARRNGGHDRFGVAVMSATSVRHEIIYEGRHRLFVVVVNIVVAGRAKGLVFFPRFG